MEERFNNFMDNHLPHLEARLGKVEGMVYILLGMGAIIIGLISTVGGHVNAAGQGYRF